MTLRQSEIKDFFQDWPKYYYESLDHLERKEKLEEYLEKHPDSKADLERKRIFDFRYDFAKDLAVDRFVKGWLDLKMYANPSFLNMNLKQANQEIYDIAKKFGLVDTAQDEYLEAEWHNFARVYITTCCRSKTYKSKFMIFFEMNPAQLALKIAQDIDYGTRAIPNIVSMAKEFEPLRKIMIEEFKSQIERGDFYWNQYMDTI